MPSIKAVVLAGSLLTCVAIATTQAQTSSAQSTLMGRTPETSSRPMWPQPIRAPKGAPNVLLIMTDDVGFGATSTFGGPTPTPTFDALARAGVRYNQFNTTALCSPTRAALLTGRDPHVVGMGNVTNLSTAYPGYTSVIPKSAGTVAEVLKQGGYSTAMFGKAHITPEWEQSPVGPFDRWPTGLGFEYFYGFLNADASQFAPAMVRNTTAVDPADGKPDYVLDRDLANDAIHWMSEHHALTPDKPFFLYYAPGTAHTPHHAPKEWLDRFKGRFDGGWDTLRTEIFRRQRALGVIPTGTNLAPRPDGMPAWDTLSPDRKRLYARYMEAYAAALAYADDQIGRLVQHLRDTGEFDNTLIIFIQGDNGASAEGTLEGLHFEQTSIARREEALDWKLAHIDDIGTARAYNHFPAPWAWAMNSPFEWYKQVASNFGGTRNGLVMSWPGHIPAGGSIRSQFHHVTDIAATILDVAHIPAPHSLNGVVQKPLDGISMAYSFDAPKAPSNRHTQVFEMMQNWGVYQDGWVAATVPDRTAWERDRPIRPVDQRKWELYRITDDFSETRDLAAREPQKLAALKDLFWQRAAEGNILPIHNSTAGEGAEGRPRLAPPATEYTYSARLRRVPQDVAPPIVNRSFTITAEVMVPRMGMTGAIVAQGGRYSGYSLALLDGRPLFTYNAVPPEVASVTAADALGPGAHRIEVLFDYDGGGRGKGGRVRLMVDGRQQGEMRVEHTLPRWISHTEGFDIGADTTTPVDPRYASPAEFAGDIRRVRITLR